MSLRELDQRLMEDMLRAEPGMAESRVGNVPITYRSPEPGAVPVPITIMLNQPRQENGDGLPLIATVTEITLLKAEVPAPRVGGVVTRGAVSWLLQDEIASNDGHSIWAVTYVNA